MLTEQFINLCCVILLDTNPKFTDSISLSISQILSSHDDDDIALPFRKKFELVKCILKLRLEHQAPDHIIDDIITAGHFQELESFISGLQGRQIPEEQVDSAIKQIYQRKQTLSIQKHLPDVEEYIKKFSTNSFTDLGEAIQYWDEMITKFHSTVMDEKRKEARSGIRELDLANDDFEDVLNQIAVSYSGENSISTGYEELDEIMNSGFEPTRLYIYGGVSGDGKSVLLNNFVKNAVEKNKHLTGPASLFTYYTLENLIDESLVRLYCSITNEKVTDFIKGFEDKRKIIQKTIKEWMYDHNSIIQMAYFPPTITSVNNLVSYSDLIKNKYEGKAILRGTYTDYLDLLRSGQTFDLHRLEMGQVTIDMKVAAVMQGIPWITVTQLNRGAYTDTEHPTLANMSESIKKVEHSDHVGILRNMEDIKPNQDPQTIPETNDFKIFIGKNRSGPKNRFVNLKATFSRFRIDSPGVVKGTIQFQPISQLQDNSACV